MAQSAAALCARALITLGARPIASLDETGTEAMVCRRLYPGIRDALLSAHPWSFATAQARLPRLNAEPLADFRYAYQLPHDFLRALSAGDGGSGRGLAYRIAAGRLHTDAEAESTSRAEALARLADDTIRRARQVDAQQDTPPRLRDFPLVEVRGA